LDTYNIVKKTGLKQTQIGNVGVFAKNEDEIKDLINIVGTNAFK
jgi:hypothetical protein